MNASPFFPVALLGLVAAFSAPLDLVADEKSKMMRHGRMKKMTCAGCHGMTGADASRDGKLVAPPYENSIILRNDPETFALILLKGISAEGSDYTGAMNGMEKIYDDRDLAAVMTFVRNRWGGHDDYISTEQAAAWRAKYADRTEPVTREELEEARKSASR